MDKTTFIQQVVIRALPTVDTVDQVIDQAVILYEHLQERGYGKKERKTTKVFIPPTLAEVTTYVKQKKYGVDPLAFFSHYKANGWMRGATKIKCWKSCLTTWEAKDKGAQKKDDPAWAKIPKADSDLMPWAIKHGYPAAKHERYPEYRQKLRSCVEKRLNAESE